MARKFTARYNNDDELSRMIIRMKSARKASGYSQVQFSKLIGISRETVVHIEGLVECTVLSLECEVLKRWFAACAAVTGETEQEKLKTAISDYLFSSIAANRSIVAHDLTQQRQQKVA